MGRASSPARAAGVAPSIAVVLDGAGGLQIGIEDRFGVAGNLDRTGVPPVRRYATAAPTASRSRPAASG
jgi:hypothetical protein